MSSDLKQDILDSIEDIGDLLTSYESLLETVKLRSPNNIELAAMGTILHSFYNGVEGVFLLVSKQIDKTTPDNSSWHQSLLNQMMTATEERANLISPESASHLAPYLKFRHFFRHAYAFMLDWSRLKPLADDLMAVWGNVKEELTAFCDTHTSFNP